MSFHNTVVIFFNRSLVQSENKIKEHMIDYIRTDYTNIIKSFEMMLNSKYGTGKLKTKNQRYRNTQKQNTETQKPSISYKIFGTK